MVQGNHGDGAGERHEVGAAGAEGGCTSAAEYSSTTMGEVHDDDAMGCCFARWERWEGSFLVRVGCRLGWGGTKRGEGDLGDVACP